MLSAALSRFPSEAAGGGGRNVCAVGKKFCTLVNMEFQEKRGHAFKKK